MFSLSREQRPKEINCSPVSEPLMFFVCFVFLFCFLFSHTNISRWNDDISKCGHLAEIDLNLSKIQLLKGHISEKCNY